MQAFSGVKIYFYTTTIYGGILVHGDKLCSIFPILAGWGKPLTPVNSRAQRQTNFASGQRQIVFPVTKPTFTNKPAIDDWYKRVQASRSTELKSFAEGLLTDEAAVRAALSSEWSNGQTEGHVNRLKMFKQDRISHRMRFPAQLGGGRRVQYSA